MSACAGEFKSQRVHCAGAQAPKSTKPEAIPQSAGAGVWGATSRRQFRLSGRIGGKEQVEGERRISAFLPPAFHLPPAFGFRVVDF